MQHPEKTNPMSRRDVMAYIDNIPGVTILMSDLHDKNMLTVWIQKLSRNNAINKTVAYDNVIGALIHFWKTS